ncbi:Gfo/Idh/MocA family oxidoreductase [Saccharopolyspora sp. NFXS83]|uniref:Gfo/Idh/MocA family protein n=1 Tax=Saccharopolyspora sp. NFXS83 TaxID=2993560 RepID=UPI00224B3767|nr:Gfo/Idh/MocA family oxidoreductase [Saccharopolyspora sp. NFXS83]MCX2731043.1 Gfo/Idh/MocA family oxidoreductase [Saccharopolyspora sp. NFXS83]
MPAGAAVTARLSLGVLGCSAIARRRTIPALDSLGNVRLAAVASRSAEKAERFAAAFGAEPCGYVELIERPDVDAVYLSLPNMLHHEWARRALLAGKHVLCEKPLTGDPSTTEELIDLAAERGLVLRENFAFLHHPQHARVRELMADGRLGAIRTLSVAFTIPSLPSDDIRYNAALGGGSLLDLGVYPLRLAWLLFGDGLSVAGAALRVDERLGVDVAGQALLVSRGGVFVDLQFGFQHSYRCRYEVWGSTASLSLDRAFTPPPEHRPAIVVEEQDHDERFFLPPAHQFRLSVSSFADAALRGAVASEEERWLTGALETARLVEDVRAASAGHLA